jgi:very-short-patch-repair endonuclease
MRDKTKERARKPRKEATPQEIMMWSRLKAEDIGSQI